MEAKRCLPVCLRMTFAPRRNSEEMAVTTPAPREKATSEKNVECSFEGRSPAAIRTIEVVTMAAMGRTKLRRMLLKDALHQARSGPIPVRKRRKSPIGRATRLKNGAPTVTLLPCTYSEVMGNKVPHKMVKQAASRTRLLKRKLDSRETS